MSRTVLFNTGAPCVYEVLDIQLPPNPCVLDMNIRLQRLAEVAFFGISWLDVYVALHVNLQFVYVGIIYTVLLKLMLLCFILYF